MVKQMLIGVAVVLTWQSAGVTNAAESAPASVAAKPASASLIGEVMAVDKARKTITLDIKGRVFVFRLTEPMKVRLNAQEVSPDLLAPGQTTRLLTRRNAQGNFEIVALEIEPSDDELVPAGEARSGENARPQQPAPTLPTEVYTEAVPFRTGPAPTNQSGGGVSRGN